MSEVLKKFGRYFLLDNAAKGGMAEIYRARFASAEGPSRIIVIKKIQANVENKSEFLKMFRSEIQVTMGFNHPNIVQLYDFGEEDGEPYIAMEWIDGKSLRQILNQSIETRQKIPIFLIVNIFQQAASGLHYAHVFKDKMTGDPLNIIHRDISPQNILVTFGGVAKIIDFGIAKASLNSETTRTGIIKGKPSYLSPEQIVGDTLDARSDVFSLGAVIWEMITGRKLFAGDNDLAVLKLIEDSANTVKPPSQFNPSCPIELDEIVLKALARRKSQRFQSAEELEKAMRKFSAKNFPDVDGYECSRVLKTLFSQEIIEDQKKLKSLNEKAQRLIVGQSGVLEIGQNAILEDISIVPSHSEVASHTQAIGYHLDSGQDNQKNSQKVNENKSKQTESSVELSHTYTPQRENSRSKKSSISYQNTDAPYYDGFSTSDKIISVIRFLIVLIAMLGFGLFLYKNPQLQIQLTDQFNSFLGTRKKVTTNSFNKETLVTMPDSSTDGSLNASVSKNILLKLNINPSGGVSTITVNGILLNHKNPSAKVPINTALEINIERNGYKHYHEVLYLYEDQVGELKEWVADCELVPLHFGYLSIHSTPEGIANIPIDGTNWVLKTPFDKQRIPAGFYVIKLVNELLGMQKSVNVEVIEGKSVSIDTKLAVKD